MSVTVIPPHELEEFYALESRTQSPQIIHDIPLNIREVFVLTPLSPDQEKLTHSSSFLVQGAGKINDYLREEHNYCKLYNIPVIAAAIGAFTGAASGAAIGALIGYKIGNGLGNLGGLIGASIGGWIGCIAGGVSVGFSTFSAIQIIINFNVRNTEIYKNYLKNESLSVLAEYSNFLERNDNYTDFICPITKDFIEVPVKYPGCNIVYEKLEIERCIRDNPIGINSPSRDIHMEINKLRYDFTYFPNLIKILNDDVKKLFRENINIAINKRVKELIESRNRAIQIIMRQIFDLYEIQHIISRKQYNVAIIILKKEAKSIGRLLNENEN